ncbi:guanylate cyclase soluble subunit alpha-2-like [Saccostrea echinata]|uniref:guanylate cyclase soluble subunit alpha-2-like n=1 Tax=Saccostrea echinata TaxID=191078 RepID=UPI002A80A345|nr:guanylate cyclase soluble subunit alpha-2-like [Saccostrea echinata]
MGCTMSCQGQKLIDAENPPCPFALKYGKGNSVEHGDRVDPQENNKLVSENSRNKFLREDEKETCDTKSVQNPADSVKLSCSGNTRNSGTCDSPKRKTSTLSTVSTASSVGSEDNELSEKKVDLIGLIESVGTLLLPTTGFVCRAVQILLASCDQDILNKIRDEAIENDVKFSTAFNEENRHTPLDQDELLKFSTHVAKLTDTQDEKGTLCRLGEEYAKLCLSEYRRSLSVLGSNMVEFFSNLDGFHDHILKSSKFNAQRPPSFRCENSPNHVVLHIYTERSKMLDYYAGIVKYVSNSMFSLDVQITVHPNETKTSLHHIIKVQTSVKTCSRECSCCKICSHQSAYSENPEDLRIGFDTFCETFPFHLIMNRNLEISQLGTALMKTVRSEEESKELSFTKYFKVIRPEIKQLTFSALLSRVNFAFLLKTRVRSNDNLSLNEGTLLKGQLIFLPESDSLMFLGSPSIEKLDELISKGLYISDVPIHDATRDVILVGEQTKAQDGLTKRMEQIKKSILEGSEAVNIEKQKNVELLNMIFPEAIAMKLWRGEPIQPTKVDDVTMLFSDIVGFTAICATCTPMMVVNMLNSLYTQFDHYCGMLDVYKVETIGDAYCVAGGLHRKSNYHAQQIAWMALKMMETAKNELSHDGNVIRMRIGIHTGSVLAGVVGARMPRYCLFGNNVNLANKFESGSEPTRINISPTTYRCLQATEGFIYTPRTREDLPSGFPQEIDGVCYFLDGYEHPSFAGCDDTEFDHIDFALQELSISKEVT